MVDPFWSCSLLLIGTNKQNLSQSINKKHLQEREIMERDRKKHSIRACSVMFFYNEISPTRETECAHKLENSHQQVMLLRIGVMRQENNLTSL